jgi:hypothetical protein
MIELYSPDPQKGLGKLLYCKLDALIEDLKDLDHFKVGLGLFDLNREAKIKEMNENYKIAKLKKSKLTEEKKKEIEDNAKVDLEQFEFDLDSLYNDAR